MAAWVPCMLVGSSLALGLAKRRLSLLCIWLKLASPANPSGQFSWANESPAPASIRGLCTCIFTGFVYIGIVLAYFANYGAEINLGDTSAIRWVCLSSRK